MGKRITSDEFAERVSNFTNGRISIVKDTFTGTRNKVTAYCNIHKVYFEVPVSYRLCCDKKCNRPECHNEIMHKFNQSKIKLWKDVYEQFKNKYGNKFSYDESTYNGTKEEMTIYCNDCGETFKLSPVHHLKYNNGGCPICRLTKIVKCIECGK